MHADRLTLKQQAWILAGLAAAAFAFRLLPYCFDTLHEPWLWYLWGATPVLAMFLLSMSKSRSYWLGLGIPLAGYLISDLIIEQILVARGLDSSSLRGRLTIYGYFLVIAQLGLLLKYLRVPFLAKLAAAYGTSVIGWTIFFVVTNFVIWYKATPASPIPYPPTWEGLMECYALAWPFHRNQLLMEPLFIVSLFGAYALLEARYATRREPVPESITT